MTDTFICSSDFEGLASFCAPFPNVIPPQKGRPALPETTDEGGSVVPATQAIGDPAKSYACIRSDEALSLPQGIEICEREICVAVVGVWA